jgi:type I restriction-modification system DNA methylase subunit
MATTKSRTKDTQTRSNQTNGEAANHSKLLKELFQAAAELRGSIGPADYKRYVLPLIFLRFLSERFQEPRAEFVKEASDPEGGLYGIDLSELQVILDDPDEYRARGAFVVPPEAPGRKVSSVALTT